MCFLQILRFDSGPGVGFAALRSSLKHALLGVPVDRGKARARAQNSRSWHVDLRRTSRDGPRTQPAHGEAPNTQRISWQSGHTLRFPDKTWRVSQKGVAVTYHTLGPPVYREVRIRLPTFFGGLL